MQDSDAAGGLIARAANRFLCKANREAVSVLSNAQRHRITSVFLVLPPNRMDA
ncbi:hypothetical protein [Roseobacter sp.]|uniref:hypothetical protein n=1 Tax=Roseobacter sp. TaxID=1907202 RepID=UPI0032976AD4